MFRCKNDAIAFSRDVRELFQLLRYALPKKHRSGGAQQRSFPCKQLASSRLALPQQNSRFSNGRAHSGVAASPAYSHGGSEGPSSRVLLSQLYRRKGYHCFPSSGWRGTNLDRYRRGRLYNSFQARDIASNPDFDEPFF